MSTLPDRRVPLSTAPNMRDLGGLPVATGVLRHELVFRSASLANLSEDDQRTVMNLDIRTVYDLRTAAERSSAPDQLPPSIPSISLDVLADSPAAGAANINALLADPTQLAAAMQQAKAQNLDGAEILADSYRDIVRLPSALQAYRSFYLGLVDADRDGAALFHCTTGKDRTGWAAASLLLLLGADTDTVFADYLQTNTDLLPALQPLFDRAESAGIPAEVLTPVLGVREEYLQTALDEVAARFGSVDGYFRSGLGLGDAELAALHERFIA